MRRLTHFIVLAAFVFSLGGHWYLLQGLAWVNMVREYSQMVPLTQAVEMTLSGNRPKSEEHRLQWKTLSLSGETEQYESVPLAGTLVTLQPMEIRTFVVRLMQNI